MRNGQTPIHIQRWAPADFHADENVKLLKARRAYLELTFYRNFIDASFMAGGDLPADREALAAMVDMPERDVCKALTFCLGRLLSEENGRIFQKRVRRDVARELEFREIQSENGKRGGRPKKAEPFDSEKATLSAGEKGSESPPAPYALRPTPAPSPEDAALPAILDVPNFRSAWANWFAYRRESKLRVWKPVTVEAKLTELAECGPERAIEAIRCAIANGWGGIFPKHEGKPAPRASAIPSGGSSDAEREELRNLGRKR